MPPELAFAHTLAELADAHTLARFGALDLRVQTKPDATPVTDADRWVEQAMREALAERFPGDAVLGEEFGAAENGSGRRWVLDPIDGTKNFLRGVPVWATLIAFAVGDDVQVGVVSAPALARRWWAARGSGGWTSFAGGDPKRLAVSAVATLADASLSFSSLSGWEADGRLGPFLDLTRSVWRVRAFGDFWSHLLVAEGAVDVSAEPEVSQWDVAPLQVIVEEAGGRFSDLSGAPRIDGGSVVCSNGKLHDDVLRRLSASAPGVAGGADGRG